MKICFDGLALSKLQGTGLNTYSYELINSLINTYPQGSYDIIWDDSPQIEDWSEVKSLVYSHENFNRLKNDYSLLENYLIENKIDIYHSPNNGFSLPKKKVCPFVITVHDLIAVTNKKFVDKSYLNKFLKVFPKSLEKADKIIAVSNFIKSELLKNFQVPEEKIQVIYPACDIEPPKDNLLSSKDFLKNKYHISNPFILYVGSIHKRKNLRTLLTVFRKIKKKNKNLKLVLVGKIDGKREKYYSEIRILSTQLDISESVIFTGIVPRNDLYHFYKECLCMVNLSEYDGFPISVVEAMKLGTPILCSNIPSNFEIARHGCLFVDQRNPNDIKDSILNIMEMPGFRQKLGDAAKIRGAYFSQEQSVSQLIDIYEKLS